MPVIEFADGCYLIRRFKDRWEPAMLNDLAWTVLGDVRKFSTAELYEIGPRIDIGILVGEYLDNF